MILNRHNVPLCSFHRLFEIILLHCVCVVPHACCMLWTKSESNDIAIKLLLIFTGEISVPSGNPSDKGIHKRNSLRVTLHNKHLPYGPKRPVSKRTLHEMTALIFWPELKTCWPFIRLTHSVKVI